VVVPCNDGLVAVFAAYLDIGEPLWNDQFLFVCAFLDVDDFMVFHKSAAYLNGLTDVAELSRAVAAHHKGVGIVVILLGLCRQQGA